MRKKPSELDFDEYIRQVEPTKREKSYAWSTAIGLQQVDGLTPSDYLLEVAKKNIEGEISLNKAQALIDSYYGSNTECPPFIVFCIASVVDSRLWRR